MATPGDASRDLIGVTGAQVVRPSRREALVALLGGALLAGCARAGGAPRRAREPLGEDGAASGDGSAPGLVTVFDRVGEPEGTELPGGPDVPVSGDVLALSRLLESGSVSSIRLIGDSITAGYGCDGYGATTERVIYEGSYGTFWESAPEVSSWANDFRTYALGRGVPDFANAGISGAKMRWLAEDPHAWILEGADVAFVMLGTNDAVYSSAEELYDYARVGLAAEDGACGQLVVLSPPANERLDAQNLYGPEVIDQVLSEVCRKAGYAHVSLLDVIDPVGELMHDDHCHPTSEGSHALWEALRGALGL